MVIDKPLWIEIGRPVCQVRFQTLEGAVEDYRVKGHYVGEAALGAYPSKSHEQE